MVLARELLPNLNCSKCTTQLKKVRGCTAPPQQPVTFHGEALDRCPMRPFFENPKIYNEILLMYRWYRNKLLPDPGQVIDQPNKLLAYYIVIDSALDDAESQHREKREKEMKAKQSQQKASRQPARQVGYKGKSSRQRHR